MVDPFNTGIYAITNLLTLDCYIGSALDFRVRKKNHITLLKRNKHHSVYLQRAWNKYGEFVFEFELFESCEREELIKREQFWIDDRQPVYNMSKVAGSPLGVKHTAQSRLNMSKGKLGSKVSEETRKKMSLAHIGKVKEGSLRFLREYAKARRLAKFCQRGHPFDSENTYWHNGLRQCRICKALGRKKVEKKDGV